MNKKSLVDFLTRCNAVAQSEADLMDTWSAARLGMGDAVGGNYCADRARDIRPALTSNTASLLKSAKELPEERVKNAPNADELSALGKCEGVYATRAALPVVSLSTTEVCKQAFDSRTNATQASNLASRVFARCVT